MEPEAREEPKPPPTLRDWICACVAAVPGVVWWVAWAYFQRERERLEAWNPYGAGVIAGLVLLALLATTIVFGLFSLLLPRIGIVCRLLLFAINLSGPYWLFSR